jgi:hypothetical protein
MRLVEQRRIGNLGSRSVSEEAGHVDTQRWWRGRSAIKTRSYGHDAKSNVAEEIFDGRQLSVADRRKDDDRNGNALEAHH